MADVYIVAVYWGRRAEASDACARRLSDCLSRLAYHAAELEEWSAAGLPGKLSFRKEQLQALLEKGSTPKTGFKLELESRNPALGGASLHIQCGRTAPDPRHPENSVVLSLPAEGSVSESLIALDKLIQLMDSLVKAWEPNWGVVSTRSFAETARFPPRVPIVAWITYLSADRGRLPPLPPPSTVIEIRGYGSMVITSGERFSEKEAFSLNAALSATEALFGALLLTPTPE